MTTFQENQFSYSNKKNMHNTNDTTDIASSDELTLPDFFKTPKSTHLMMRNHAGMRVFGTLLLNAWRKQREDTQLLSKKLSKYKYNFIKSKSTIHYLDNLVREEQTHNVKLFEELKTYSNELKNTHSKNSRLKDNLTSLERTNTTLQEAVSQKDEAYDQLLSQYNMSQDSLHKVTERNKQLEKKLNDSQEKLNNLSNEKLMLVRNFEGMKNTVEKHAKDLERKGNALKETHKEMKQIRSQLQVSKEKLDGLKQLTEVVSAQHAKLAMLEKERAKVATSSAVMNNAERMSIFRWAINLISRLFLWLRSPASASPARSSRERQLRPSQRRRSSTPTPLTVGRYTIDTVQHGRDMSYVAGL